MSYTERINKHAQSYSAELKPLMPDIIKFFNGESEKFTMDSFNKIFEDVARNKEELFIHLRDKDQ